MNSLIRHITVLLFMTAITGCVIGPGYERPTIDTPQAWRLDPKEAAERADSRWWQQFKDPVLDGLIEKALSNNKDLLIAVWRVEEFLGRYGVARADLFPQFYAEGAAARDYFSETLNPVAPGIDNPDTIYQVFVTATWEIDFWGRLRRAAEAARAELVSTDEARQAVVLTLISSVAVGYIDLLSLDRQLQISLETAETRKKTLSIFLQRHQAGIVSNLELSQVKSQYQAARAAIPALESQIAQRENALSILLGNNPGPIPRGVTITDLEFPAVPAGLPSELLTRRPDIRQAEQELIAANARIGVARAAYFPRISLTGLLGSSSREISGLFNNGSGTWSYGANLAAPVFTAGRIKGQVRATEAVRQQALLNYQRRIQNAFREVEDLLIEQDRVRETLMTQHSQILALQDYARLARLRYEEGYFGYLEVLNSERDLFNSQLTYTQTRANLFNALVELYKTLGGGWADVRSP